MIHEHTQNIISYFHFQNKLIGKLLLKENFKFINYGVFKMI